MPEEVVDKHDVRAIEVKSIEDLARKVRSYSPGADIEFLKRAYWFSSEAHGMQTRKEGTPYMAHPLAVASILADMKMDTTTIAAAILHDTIEDTPTKIEDIRKRFGYELAFLVDGLTKLSRMEFKSREMAQAENFRKMLLSMAEDIRVILIKFADRLHNIRTLQYLPEGKRQRIAAETLEIYAPIANRLGIGWLKTEFEDKAFRYLMPRLYDEIEATLKAKSHEHELYINNLIETMEKKLKAEGLPGKVSGRVKHNYSIYQKIESRGVPLEQIHDVLGIRVITDTKANCYAILGMVHSLWKPIPGKFKDYIGVPKSNMYRSLHTTVIGPGGERVEFQIRTREMHRIAEEGIAAHWKYKEKDGAKHREDRYISWLRDLVQAQKDMPDARAFLEAVKAEVMPEIVYVFTPQGDIKELPAGSTPVDFAYAIHTEVGNKCVGARVNGKMVPLRHQLENGNTVEIITSQSHKPSRDWLKFVVTQRAKSRIKQWLKTEEHKQSVTLGMKLLEEELRRRHLSPSLMKSEEMENAARSYNLSSLDDLFVAVGYGKISHHQVVNRLTPEAQKEEVKPRRAARKPAEHKGITIKGVDDVLYHTAKCCFPVPGDDLVGFITRGKGVAVHRSDCPNLERLAVDEARLVEVEWESEKDVISHARLMVETVDKPGMLATLSAAISAAEVNISHLDANATQDKTARIVFILEVRDKKQLHTIIRNITQTEGVLRVRRY
jgi:guanosine-3',5'-bis(diphosphate) 3'-pyrophosphohydrolase